MRRSYSTVTTVFMASIFSLLMLTGCEGPAGPQGAAGTNGTDGIDGVDGVNAAETCTDCHTADTKIKARQVQWAASTHAIGGNFERGGSRTCAACHSHEGFVERIASGLTQPDSGFPNPSPINCRTCHQIHTNYDDTDWAFTTGSDVAFDLWIDGTTVDFGKGNVCANCHQQRNSYTVPDLAGGDITITSSRFGGHYGAQAATMQGAGYVEFTGALSYPTAPHFHEGGDACVTCHMAKAYGSQAGGHTWNMTYDSHGATEPNLAGCATCHTDTANWEALGYVGLTNHFDYKGTQTAIQTLLDDIVAKLIAANIVDPLDLTHAVPGTYTATVAGAFWNYINILNDRSLGVHNPDYVTVLLTNTLAALP